MGREIERLRRKHNMDERDIEKVRREILEEKGLSKNTPRKWEGWDKMVDINISRGLEVSYENEKRIRAIAENNNYDFHGFPKGVLLLIHRKTNDQFHAPLGSYLRIMNDAEDGDLESVSREEFNNGWERYIPREHLLARIERLEGLGKVGY